MSRLNHTERNKTVHASLLSVRTGHRIKHRARPEPIDTVC
jgi:hypothetical protein